LKVHAILTAIVLAATTQVISKEQPKHLSAEMARELRCLELNIYHEARGEGKAGMIAVGMVTVNRVKSSKFPNSICKVVKQRGQFSWYPSKHNTYIKVPAEIKQIAYDILIENKYADITNGSLYFHNRSVRSFDRKMKTKIGNHIFYI
jgi:N-acetylmuramoyl-L-alanine amidase